MSGPYRTYDPGPTPPPASSGMKWALLSLCSAFVAVVNAMVCLSWHGSPVDPVEMSCTPICDGVELHYLLGYEIHGGPGPDGHVCVCGNQSVVVRIFPDGDVYTQRLDEPHRGSL